MKVLSLFDGISACKEALDIAGIEYSNYTAIELCRHARLTADMNHRGITRPCNDVFEITGKNILYDWPSFDMIAAGFTCSSLSSMGKRKGFDGSSGIVFELVKIFLMAQKRSPNIKFIFENVASMDNESKKKLDDLFECESVLVKSQCYSKQARHRVLWTNLSFINRTEPNNDFFEGEAWSKSTRYKDDLTGKVYSAPKEGRTSYIEQRLRTDGKANTLVTGQGCAGPSTRNTINGELLSVNQCAELQGLSRYRWPVSDSQAFKQIGMGWQVDTFAQIFKEALT